MITGTDGRKYPLHIMVKILSNPNKLDMKGHYSNYFETTKNVIS